MVELKEISRYNFEDVLHLKVSEHQQAFVSSTVHSLAQAYVYRDTAFPFTMWKFLVDEQRQKKGYGREALKQGIAYLKETFDVREIYTGVALGNKKIGSAPQCRAEKFNRCKRPRRRRQ